MLMLRPGVVALLPIVVTAVTHAQTPASPQLIPGESAGVTAFVNVNVIPMDTERVLSNQTVLVERGQITALGPVAKTPIPQSALRVNGQGKYLMPGLADMHAHLGSYDVRGQGKQGLYRLFTYLANGVTTLRFLFPVSTVGEPVFRRFMEAGVLRPHIYISRSIESLAQPGLRPDSVAGYVAAYKGAGSDFIDIPHGLFREQREIYDSLLVIARRLNIPLASHNHDAFPVDELQALGAVGGSIEHLHTYAKTIGRATLSRDNLSESEAQQLRSIAETTKRAGTWITPTLECMRGRSGVAREIVKALQDANVGLLLGADADEGLRPPSPTLVHNELASLVKAGLSPYQALLTGTRNVAQYFGLLDSSGTVAIGKRADLVLLRGNPLADIRFTRGPAGVMIDGRWLDRATLDDGVRASPKAWFPLASGGFDLSAPGLTQEQRQARFAAIKVYLDKVKALTDSMEVAQVSDKASYDRLWQLLKAELRAIRAMMGPEPREIFDLIAGVWLHEPARDGSVAAPGGTSTP